MVDRLKDKVVLITGGSRGQGAAEAELFAAEGAAVVIADVLDSDGARTAAGIGDAATYHHLDVTDEEAWHALVAEILLSRAVDVSRTPEEEVVVVVAHGPGSEEDNDLWLENMNVLVERMRPRTRFSRIECLTVRDDAADPVREQATTELRAVVEGAVEEGKSALIVPLLLSYGGIEAGIRRRLEGLPYRMADQALLPDERLSEWVLMQAAAR